MLFRASSVKKNKQSDSNLDLEITILLNESTSKEQKTNQVDLLLSPALLPERQSQFEIQQANVRIPKEKQMEAYFFFCQFKRNNQHQYSIQHFVRKLY